jgi:hypothetical protein
MVMGTNGALNQNNCAVKGQQQITALFCSLSLSLSIYIYIEDCFTSCNEHTQMDPTL